MAKPGFKEVIENKHKMDAKGVLTIDDKGIFIDVSEESDGTEMINIKDCFLKLRGEFVSFKLQKAEVEEVEALGD